ncbi:MAG: DUF4951 domain-containing protein [Planctomycetaceae bacterium]
MIGNAITLHQIDSLDSYVDGLIEENGGTWSLYGAANISGHIGVVAAALATGGIVYYGPTIAMPTFSVWAGVLATEAQAVTAYGGTAAFSRLIGMGVGRAKALQRAASITLAEIRAAGVTLPVARYWRDFYQLAVNSGTGASTAPARVELFKRIIGNRKRGHSTYWTSLAFLVVEEMTQGRAVWPLLSASEYRQMGCPGQDCGGVI